MAYIGIDLGTTYSCVAIVENGQPKVIHSDHGGNIVPSVVAYSRNEILVGNPALNCNTDMANILYDSKRLIGWHDLNDLPIAEDKSFWTFNATTRNNCAGYLLYKDTPNEKFIKPEEVSAEILKHLKYMAEKYLSTKVSEAIVTISASFSSDQIAATKRAIEIAGFKLKSLLHEPTAAVIAYNQKARLGNCKLLCFDFGGGTLDVSIVGMKNEQPEPIAVTGDSHLGGQDFDSRIMKYVITEFQKSSNYDIYKKPRLIKRLRTECRRGKEALSTGNSINIHLDINDEHEINIELTRSKFVELCQDLFEKALSYVDKALKSPTNISPEQIDHVILVGGSSRIPFIHDKLSEKFGKSKLKFDINPDEAVALGAAISANSMEVNDDDDPPRNSQIKFKKMLGKGNFAKVYTADIDGEIYAVKVINPNQQFDVREAQILLGLKHPNIVKCLGMMTLPDSESEIIFEYMSGGALESYLKSSVTISLEQMKEWIKQIANGMKYIESQSMVHRDLAARNILLNETRETVKIGDFGLARRVDNNDLYCMFSQKNIPVRWQSLEVLEQMARQENATFTIKNDVWSFGILMYEIYSRGDFPYGIRDNYSIYNFLKDGNRLEKPEEAPNEIYQLMQDCWKLKPEERPTFAQIYDRLSEIS